MYLTCGLPCSGKTTRAKEIEREHRAIRLTPDEWLSALFGPDRTAETDAMRDPIEAVLWDHAERLLELGINVVLDFGVWTRGEREAFRARAARSGARTELHFLDVPLDELLARLAVRNAALPAGTFHIEEAEMRLWWTLFEAPGEDELVRSL